MMLLLDVILYKELNSKERDEDERALERALERETGDIALKYNINKTVVEVPTNSRARWKVVLIYVYISSRTCT